MQNEITKPTNVLDKKGFLVSPGWSRHMNYIYDHSLIYSAETRTKEWDFYQIIEGDWVFQITIGHVAFVTSSSMSVFNLITKERHVFERMKLYIRNNVHYENSAEVDHLLRGTGKNLLFEFEVKGDKRTLKAEGKTKKGEDVQVFITIKNNPANEKLVICTPFKESPHMFYLNYKENYYDAKGSIKIGDFKLDIQHGTGLLDSGRGYWPYSHEWFWSNASFNLPSGDQFGWNIGWGFGDLSHATENIYFFNSVGYKMGVMTEVEHDVSNPMSKIILEGNNGEFHVELDPIFDNYGDNHVLYIDTYCHQVYYKAKGWFTVKGEKLFFENETTFLEHAVNKW